MANRIKIDIVIEKKNTKITLIQLKKKTDNYN